MIEINNFISEEDLDALVKPMSTNMFPWFYIQRAVEETVKADGDFVSAPVFRHTFIKNGEQNSVLTSLIIPILSSITTHFDKPIGVQSIDANFVVPNNSLLGKQVYPHYDFDYSDSVLETNIAYTAILYLHECDGDTTFYKKIDDKYVEDFKVTPTKNKFICWDNFTYHSAPASASKERYVINMNFLIPKEE
jgi:hypothetical protein